MDAIFPAHSGDDMDMCPVQQACLHLTNFNNGISILKDVASKHSYKQNYKVTNIITYTDK